MSLKVCGAKECGANIPLHTIYTAEDLHPNLAPSACTCHQRNTDSNNFNSFWFQMDSMQTLMGIKWLFMSIFQIHVIRQSTWCITFLSTSSRMYTRHYLLFCVLL
ncbi:hypothetical protein RYX36_011478, partial [Vicia faba]